MSVTITKRVGGGFNVQVYTGILRPIRNLSYTSDGLGVRLINESGGYYTPENIEATDWTIDGNTYATYEQIGDALDLLGTGIIGSGSSGGGGGTGDASALLQTQQLNAQNALNTKIDDLITEQDNPQMITLLNDLKTADATAQASILTELQEQGLELDKIDSLKTSTDAVTAAINAAETAEAARDAAEVVRDNNLLAKEEEKRVLLEGIKNDLSGNVQAPTRTFGRDSSNNTVIIQEISADGLTVSYKEATSNAVYDIVGTGGDFIPDPTLSSDFGERLNNFIANTTNGLAGYSTDDIVQKYEVIDLNNNNLILSTTYTNLTKGTDLVTANVDPTELTAGTNKPTVIRTVDYLIVEDGSKIVNRAYRVLRDNSNHIWVDEAGNISETIITGNQELVRSDLEVSRDLEQPNSFPFTIDRDTFKDLSIGVDSGEYTVEINDGATITMNSNSFPLVFDTPDVKNSWVNDKIVINQVTAGSIVISGTFPGTLSRLAGGTGNTVDPQVYIDAKSDFIFDASVTSDFITDGAGDVTTINTVAETGTTDTFTTSTAGFKLQDSPGGLQGLRSSTGATTSFTKTTPITNTEELRVVAFSMDSTEQAIKFKFTRFTNQVSIQGTNISYNLNDGAGNVPTPIANYGFSANELNGNEGIVMGITRKLINAGADYEIVLTIYNRANPNGIVAATTSTPVASSGQSRTFAPASAWVHYMAAVDISVEADFINIAKSKVGL